MFGVSLQAPLVDSLPAPYGDEIRGLAKATGIHVGMIVIKVIKFCDQLHPGPNLDRSC